MAKTPEEKKAAQAAVHKRWRESEKGKAYYARRRNGFQEGQQAGTEVQAIGQEAAAEEAGK